MDTTGDPTVDSKESDLPNESRTANKSDQSNNCDLPDMETNEEMKTDNETGLSKEDIDISANDLTSGQLVNTCGTNSNSPKSQLEVALWNFQ